MHAPNHLEVLEYWNSHICTATLNRMVEYNGRLGISDNLIVGVDLNSDYDSTIPPYFVVHSEAGTRTALHILRDTIRFQTITVTSPPRNNIPRRRRMLPHLSTSEDVRGRARVQILLLLLSKV